MLHFYVFYLAPLYRLFDHLYSYFLRSLQLDFRSKSAQLAALGCVGNMSMSVDIILITFKFKNRAVIKSSQYFNSSIDPDQYEHVICIDPNCNNI